MFVDYLCRLVTDFKLLIYADDLKFQRTVTYPYNTDILQRNLLAAEICCEENMKTSAEQSAVRLRLLDAHWRIVSRQATLSMGMCLNELTVPSPSNFTLIRSSSGPNPYLLFASHRLHWTGRFLRLSYEATLLKITAPWRLLVHAWVLRGTNHVILQDFHACKTLMQGRLVHIGELTAATDAKETKSTKVCLFVLTTYVTIFFELSRF